MTADKPKVNRLGCLYFVCITRIFEFRYLLVIRFNYTVDGFLCILPAEPFQ